MICSDCNRARRFKYFRLVSGRRRNVCETCEAKRERQAAKEAAARVRAKAAQARAEAKARRDNDRKARADAEWARRVAQGLADEARRAERELKHQQARERAKSINMASPGFKHIRQPGPLPAMSTTWWGGRA